MSYVLLFFFNFHPINIITKHVLSLQWLFCVYSFLQVFLSGSFINLYFYVLSLFAYNWYTERSSLMVYV